MSYGKLRTHLRVELRIAVLFVVAMFTLALFANPTIASAQGIPLDGEETTIFFPAISSGEGADAFAIPTQTPTVNNDQAYSLLGRLDAVAGHRYAFTLTTADGAVYGLAGQTPEIELEIMQLGQATAPVLIKVWGTIYPDVVADRSPLIVVTGILPAVNIPRITAFAVPVAIVQFDRVNLHDRPNSGAAPVAQITRNQACDVIGKNRQETWLQLGCLDGTVGWVDARLVEVEGDIAHVAVTETSAPVVTVTEPAPTPTPVPTNFNFWKVSMFDNPRLAGDPVAYSDVENVNFDWGSASPSSLVPVNNFSMRFERTIPFETGYYQFSVQADDGVRLWLDGQLIIDEWRGSSGRIYTVGRTLAGEHDLAIEYYETSGTAMLRFEYVFMDEEPSWEAEYYRGTGLNGPPVLVQGEPRSPTPLDYNWTLSSPAPDALDGDFWSARWIGEFRFEGGDYVFQAIADDGVRVYVDDQVVIDQWRDGYKDVRNTFVGIGRGVHTIKVEYYERSGTATLRVWWFEDPNQ